MPIEHHIDHAQKLITVRDNGAASLDEIAASVQRLLAEASVDASYRLLINVSGSALEPSYAELCEIIEHLRLLRQKFTGRIALLNTTAGLSVPTQITAMAVDPSCTQVLAFGDEQEARQWLVFRYG